MISVYFARFLYSLESCLAKFKLNTKFTLMVFVKLSHKLEYLKCTPTLIDETILQEALSGH